MQQPDSGVEGVDLAALASWMNDQRLGAGPVQVVQRLAGGTQNILVLLERAGRRYVLRRPPLHLRANSNETMRREARVLHALAGTDVPHPALIAACPDEQVLGAAFYLMEPIDGFNAMSGLPESHRFADLQHAMGLSVADALAALGRVDPVANGLADFGKPDDFLARQAPRWLSQLESNGQLNGWPGPGALGDVAAVAAWLEAGRPTVFTPGLMHGDYHMANVMFRNDGPQVAAIIDWELATLGDPLLDLGWLLATWPQPGDPGFMVVAPWIGFPSAAELVERYGRGSARDLTAIGWYAVLACFKLGILLEGTYARARAGQAPAETGDRLHANATWLFERARRWMAEGPFGAWAVTPDRA